MDQFDSSSCETFFPVAVKSLNVDFSIRGLMRVYGNQFVDGFRQK